MPYLVELGCTTPPQFGFKKASAFYVATFPSPITDKKANVTIRSLARTMQLIGFPFNLNWMSQVLKLYVSETLTKAD